MQGRGSSVLNWARWRCAWGSEKTAPETGLPWIGHTVPSINGGGGGGGRKTRRLGTGRLRDKRADYVGLRLSRPCLVREPGSHVFGAERALPSRRKERTDRNELRRSDVRRGHVDESRQGYIQDELCSRCPRNFLPILTAETAIQENTQRYWAPIYGAGGLAAG